MARAWEAGPEPPQRGIRDSAGHCREQDGRATRRPGRPGEGTAPGAPSPAQREARAEEKGRLRLGKAVLSSSSARSLIVSEARGLWRTHRPRECGRRVFLHADLRAGSGMAVRFLSWATEGAVPPQEALGGQPGSFCRQQLRKQKVMFSSSAKTLKLR